MIAPAWIAAGVAGAVAFAASLADRARRRRADLDRMGWVDWPMVQTVSLIALAIAAAIGFAR